MTSQRPPGGRYHRRATRFGNHGSPRAVDDHIRRIDGHSTPPDSIDRGGHLTDHDDVADRHRRAALPVRTIVGVVAGKQPLGDRLDRLDSLEVDRAPMASNQPVATLVRPTEAGIDVAVVRVAQLHHGNRPAGPASD